MKLAEAITIEELRLMAQSMYDELVKAVVDVEEGLLVVDAPMHVDEEQFLLERGSLQENLWGINLYPDDYGTDDFVEFDSMINIRPAQNNRSRGVDDEALQVRIRDIVDGVVNG
ncbi:DUF5674 family protein [Adlercreutzia sp. ZJ176]|nr:DUF5674 family protein [Adlercreutzia sp. ZJ176]